MIQSLRHHPSNQNIAVRMVVRPAPTNPWLRSLGLTPVRHGWRAWVGLVRGLLLQHRIRSRFVADPLERRYSSGS